MSKLRIGAKEGVASEKVTVDGSSLEMIAASLYLCLVCRENGNDMKPAIFALCLLLLNPVLAATNSPAPLPKIEVKGFVLGMSMDDWIAKLNGAKHTCVQVETKNGITTSCWLEGGALGTQSFAGVHDVNFGFGFHNDRLWRVYVHEIKPLLFDAVVATMEKKYGMPVIEHDDLQNAMGAHFDGANATWHGENGTILYLKYVGDITLPSSLIFFSTDAWNALLKKGDQRSEKAASDM